MRRASFAVLLIAVVAVATGAAWHEASASFHRVSDRVWAGGQPSSDDLALLCGSGVRTVVDLREAVEHDVDAERLASERLGMAFVHVPVRGDAPEDREADAFLAVTARADAYPILVHCASGNRAAAFWMIHRLVLDRWTVEAAEGEARRIGLRSTVLRNFALDYAERRLAAAPVDIAREEP